MTKKEAF